ncbi:MAG: alternative ribosome rescue aminoacyl-tRNA hydrolase ArfB [Bacteroidota bacterium]
MNEVTVVTARSGGPGGQHVNKVETKVVLRWNVRESNILSDLQKQLIIASHKTKLTKNGELVVVADGKRSQPRNKEIALKKLEKWLAQAFIIKKKRIPSTPSKAARKKRLDSKKKHGEKKALRRKLL